MELRYRVGLRRLPWFALLFPVVAIARQPDSAWNWLPVLAIVLLTSPLWMRMGVDLRPDALVVRGWRVREIPWDDVDEVRAEKHAPWVAVAVVRGKKRYLSAPRHRHFGYDEPFHDTVESIRRYWQERRAALVPAG